MGLGSFLLDDELEEEDAYAGVLLLCLLLSSAFFLVQAAVMWDPVELQKEHFVFLLSVVQSFSMCLVESHLLHLRLLSEVDSALVGNWVRRTTSSVVPSPLAACSLETNSITQVLMLSTVGTAILCSCATILGLSTPLMRSVRRRWGAGVRVCSHSVR